MPVFAEALGEQVCLGMVPRKSGSRAPKLATYLTDAPSNAPAAVDYHSGVAALARMYMNNVYGCCVISGKAHSIGLWSKTDAKADVQLTDQQIVDLYRKLAAVPGQDSGCVITDVLDYLVASGFPDSAGGGHKIDGYVAVDPTNRELVKAAVYLFGAPTIGFMVTNQMVRSAKNGAVWSSFDPNDVAGGHDVSVVGYDETGVKLSTWGVVVTMAWSVFTDPRCVTECYALLSPDWYGTDKVSAATGLNVGALKADMDALRNGKVPDVTPPPVPPLVPGHFTGTLGAGGVITGTFDAGAPRGPEGFGPADVLAWLELAKVLLDLLKEARKPK